MTSATHPGDTAVLRRQSQPGSFGPFQLQQLVLLEIAAALLLVAYAVDPLLLIPAACVAVALVLLAVTRRRQRAVTEWLTTALALRRRARRGAQPIPADTDPALAPVVECDPALRTYAFITDSTGERRSIGMIGDGTFLTAVLRIQGPDAPLRAARTERPLPLGLLNDALEVDDVRLESVQVVQHTQPAPAPHLPEQAVAARSYAPLQAQTGTPAVRLTWVALKLDPELCREAIEARGGGLEGTQRCLLRAVDQLASRLTGAGFRASALGEDELVAAVSTSAGANPQATAQASGSDQSARRTVETARAWRCDDRWHTTYWVRRWPQLGSGAGAAQLPQLVALLTSSPALASTFSLTLGRGSGRAPALSGHVRITGRSDDELVAARRELERTARGVKVGLVRLDREQLPGVLATLPLGGTR
ncbi:type VII secretion protein EccE [Streptomyces sp. H27-D2]|uniref:type VII secretion protein EccE n=1 Tax=Streptomyces sp. H27-D2 TaxID=3046304 RepID=UPI002DB9707B|nr:type VII secretion protein EccE [Streptomyces sp. H27-D2]MEC4019165.1 type VII secretion protein EccE [Streptomyces sp. H27-D2]